MVIQAKKKNDIFYPRSKKQRYTTFVLYHNPNLEETFQMTFTKLNFLFKYEIKFSI